MKKLIVYFLLVSLVIGFVSALGIGGNKLKITVPHEPGVQEYNFYAVNNDGYTADFEIFARNEKTQVNFVEYITITPSEYKNVPTGGNRPFTVAFDLPEHIDSPGPNEVRVWVRGIAAVSGGLTARPVVGIRFFLFVLYPWKTIVWGIALPPLNVNDKEDFIVPIENLGEPTVDSVYALIDVYSSQDSTPLRSLKTNTERNFVSKEKRELKATFDTTGLLAGQYYAQAALHWDGNISYKNYSFFIGTKNVEILNYTKLFEFNAINRFDLIVKSDWNDPIDKINAHISIFDTNKENQLASFQSFDSSLEPLEKKTLEAYFDTSGLEKGEYLAVINLAYDGSHTVAEGIIRIDENINGAVVEEIPGRFNLGNLLPEKFEIIHILSIFLVIFIIINVYLLYHTLSKKSKKEKKVEIDESVINHARELKKKYNDEYIKNMMIKKGWDNDKIKEIFKRLKSR